MRSESKQISSSGYLTSIGVCIIKVNALGIRSEIVWYFANQKNLNEHGSRSVWPRVRQYYLLELDPEYSPNSFVFPIIYQLNISYKIYFQILVQHFGESYSYFLNKKNYSYQFHLISVLQYLSSRFRISSRWDEKLSFYFLLILVCYIIQYNMILSSFNHISATLYESRFFSFCFQNREGVSDYVRFPKLSRLFPWACLLRERLSSRIENESRRIANGSRSSRRIGSCEPRTFSRLEGTFHCSRIILLSCR